MKPFYLVHIAGGALAILGGYVALFTPKGGRVHRKAGMLFVYAMFAMALGAAVLAVPLRRYGNLGIVALVAYTVVTALTTVRPTTDASRRLDRWLAVLGLVLGIASIAGGLAMIGGPPGRTQGGVPVATIGRMSVLNGVVVLLGVVGDVRVLRSGPLRGKPRIVRHLWRMCFATWLASGSFFLGQMKVIPKPLRVVPVLTLLAFLPLLAMLYYLTYWRWFGGRVRRARALAAAQLAPVQS